MFVPVIQLDHDKALDYYDITHGDTLNALVTVTKKLSPPRKQRMTRYPSIHLFRSLLPDWRQLVRGERPEGWLAE